MSSLNQTFWSSSGPVRCLCDRCRSNRYLFKVFKEISDFQAQVLAEGLMCWPFRCVVHLSEKQPDKITIKKRSGCLDVYVSTWLTKWPVLIWCRTWHAVDVQRYAKLSGRQRPLFSIFRTVVFGPDAVLGILMVHLIHGVSLVQAFYQKLRGVQVNFNHFSFFVKLL